MGTIWGRSVCADAVQSFWWCDDDWACLDLGRIDIAGFSFGGRVALAFAASHPTFIHKCAVTSISADRGGHGRLVLQQWKALLDAALHLTDPKERAAAMRNFGFSSIMASHSRAFLARNEARVGVWADLVAAGNTPEGIAAIIAQTHEEDPESPQHPLMHAARCREHGVPGVLFYGAMDGILDPTTADSLAQAAGWGHAVPFEGCGHAVPLESPTNWRNKLLEFLDQRDGAAQ